MKKLFVLFCICAIIVNLVLPNVYVRAQSLDAQTGVECEEVVDEQSSDNSGGSRSGSSSDTGYLYVLGVENGEPCLPRAFDYSTKPELLSLLKRGDVIYEPLAGSALIEGLVGHISVVIDIAYDTTYNQQYVLLVEAAKGGGVFYGILYPERFDGLNAVVMRFTNISDSTIEAATDWIENQIGKGYHFYFGKNYSEDSETWYCSELVWAAYYNQGVYLASNNSSNRAVYPREFDDYEGFTKIMEYNESTVVEVENSTYHKITCGEDEYLETHDCSTVNFCYEECYYCGYYGQATPHNYTYDFENCNNGNYHYAYCQCGARIDVLHNYTYDFENCNNGNYHYAYCQCGARIDVLHNYTHDYENYNNENYHYAYCQCGSRIATTHSFITSNNLSECTVCGYTKTIHQEHFYIYTPTKDGRTHVKSCSCGYSQVFPCVGRVGVDGSNRCISCGWIVSGGGIGGLLSDGDEEENSLLGYVSQPTLMAYKYNWEDCYEK